MKILFVGPGTIEIPSKGWGAVETVIWQLKLCLEKDGHSVSILNKKGLYHAIKSQPWKYDLVHLQYDDYANLWNILSAILKFKLIVTSHYGYAAWPSKWYVGVWGGYKKVFNKLFKSKGIIALSPEIMKVYINRGFRGYIAVLPNGTETSSIRFSEKPCKDFICLGKVEPRKQQAKLCEALAKRDDIDIDFVGPIADKSFRCNNKNQKYLGTWTREEVREKLTEYKALILLSDGEAHALVVGEALAAGLSLIISEEASANLDTTKPFINIIDINEQGISDKMRKVLLDNQKYRKEIRKYSKDFDWQIIARRYLEIVSEYIHK